ncbi:4'-phosphopantetheinyl transferase family protein [Microbacterium album]|uniref:4'-phosphopantetheinyl transferase n=1 Tax=Microbacterium album TaxID=2053191 RepID=A0A917MME1_9MICO|nr:hypothetical protein [Microbacterium album]GGH43927.1 4'-phosphopantetheinyl transferase [Microbacterium album]
MGPALVAWAHAHRGTPTEADALLDALGDAQRRRWAGLNGTAASRFLTGRMLLAELIGELAPGHPITLSSRCDRCGGAHGRPRAVAAPVVLSVAYAGPLVVAAAARATEAAAIGVDVEAGDAAQRLPDLDRLFAPAPPPDLRGWTRIEAALKADGRGVRVPPADVRFGPASALSLPGAVIASVPGRAPAIEVATIPGPAEHVLSIAIAPPPRS